MPARLARLATAFLLAVASVVLLGSAPAHACRCVFGDLPRQVDRADAVFVGTFAPADRTVADGRIRFDLAVDEVYRGRVGERLTVEAPYASATCGLDAIPAGEPVAWFVRCTPAGVVRSDLCSGTTVLTPKLTRQLERQVGPATAPATSGPLVDGDGGISSGDPSTSPDPGGSSTASGPSGSGDRSEQGTPSDDALPDWAWVAILVAGAGGVIAAVRAVVRRLPTHS